MRNKNNDSRTLNKKDYWCKLWSQTKNQYSINEKEAVSINVIFCHKDDYDKFIKLLDLKKQSYN